MKVGIIDHHLNNFHANKFHEIITKTPPTEADSVEIVAAYESHPEGADWCEAKKVRRAATAKEVVESADLLLVLAPDHVGTHPELSQEALRSGKPVFLDKSISGTLEDARTLISLAQKHNTPLMSSSSLRFSVELEELLGRVAGKSLDGIFSRGLAKWRGYSVHTLAPVIRMIQGDRIQRLIDTSSGTGARTVTLETSAGKRIYVETRESENQFEATPWQIGALVNGRYETATITKLDQFYVNHMHEILRFGQSRKSPVPVEEQFEILAVELAADDSIAQGNQWVAVPAL